MPIAIIFIVPSPTGCQQPEVAYNSSCQVVADHSLCVCHTDLETGLQPPGNHHPSETNEYSPTDSQKRILLRL